MLHYTQADARGQQHKAGGKLLICGFFALHRPHKNDYLNNVWLNKIPLNAPAASNTQSEVMISSFNKLHLLQLWSFVV